MGAIHVQSPLFGSAQSTDMVKSKKSFELSSLIISHTKQVAGLVILTTLLEITTKLTALQ